MCPGHAQHAPTKCYNTLMKIPPHTAHIWFANLDTIKIDYAVLSDAEKTRASKMHFTEHQHRTAAARFVLRSLLSKYLDVSAADIELQQTDKGKLFLANSELKFNLAHSHEYAIYAFALNCDVGVDIEQQRDNIEFDGIAKRVMSSQEYNYWSALAAEEKNELFFQIWTRKEALIKCTGDGLSGPLKDLSTIDSEGEICRTVNYANQTQLDLTDLSAPKNYYAALASEQYLQIYYHPLPEEEISSAGS